MEMYEDCYERKQTLEHRIESGEASGKARQEAVDQLRRLNSLLGENEFTDDPLIDEWEQDLRDGRVPDLDKK